MDEWMDGWAENGWRMDGKWTENGWRMIEERVENRQDGRNIDGIWIEEERVKSKYGSMEA